MTNHSWTVIGLAIDIVGALLLSVEAIKLDNIRALKQGVFTPISALLFKLPKSEAAWLMAGSALVLGAAVLAKPITENVGWFNEPVSTSGLPVPFNILASIGLGIGGSLVTVAITYVVGQLGLRILAYASLLPVAALTVVDRHTPAGTIGIVGAFLVVVGFIFQMIGA